MPDGKLLKRVFLIFLFNISICGRGAALVQKNPNGIKNILGCLGTDNTTVIQTLALTMMNALLVEIPTYEFCQKVKNFVSLPLCEALEDV